MNIKNVKLRFILTIICIVSLAGLLFINQCVAGQITETNHLEDKPSSVTKIAISTSAPVKFISYYSSDIIPKLVIEFQTKNILSEMKDEVLVNEGPVRKIISNYFGKGQNRSLKSLTFELVQKAPYKIWQEENAIILAIQIPPEALMSFSVGSEQSEISEAEAKRLQAMDKVLEQTKKELDKPKDKIISPQDRVMPVVMPVKEKRSAAGWAFWPIGLILACGLGFLLWQRYKSATEKEITKLKAELQKKEMILKQAEIIRKTVETTSLQIEKENQQLKKKLHESAEKPQIPQQIKERRQAFRLDLGRDYTKTIILRIKLQDKDRDIKAFANNVSIGGLCFQTRKEFKKEKMIDLRLFFFGYRVPMIKAHVHIVWQKTIEPLNYYGVSFDRLNKKDEIELGRYIESKTIKRSVS